MGWFGLARANWPRTAVAGWASALSGRAEPDMVARPDIAGRGEAPAPGTGVFEAAHSTPDRKEPESGAPISPGPPGPQPGPGHSRPHGAEVEVPRGLRVMAAWSWRLMLVALAGVAVLWALGRLQLVVVPLVIALLLAALLAPFVGWLRRHGLNRSLAALIALVTGLAAVIGTLTLVINEFIDGFPELSRQTADGVRQIQNWLHTGPLHLSDKQINDAVNAAQSWLNTNRDSLTIGALNTATTLGHVLTGIFLVLFSTYFFLRDGRRISQFLLSPFPERIRVPTGSAADAAWRTLVGYVRATVLVAFIDALGIGLALVILRVDFALPLAALVFLGAFIPIIGATLSGAVAILVALVTQGPVIALLTFAAVIAVQQLEGHVLQPVIMGRAVAIHPLAVIVGIAVGLDLAGIIGALVAVPTIAVLNTGVRHLIAHRRERAQPVPDAAAEGAEPPSPRHQADVDP